VYGFNPRAPIDILPLPTSEWIHSDAKEHADFILQMHETTKHNIEKMKEKYRIAGSKGRKEVKLEPSDLVWLHLRKDRLMIMHINLSCLPSLGLVLPLIFQI
jgi:hypothetical protein